MGETTQTPWPADLDVAQALRGLLEATHDFVAVLDLEGRILYLNRAENGRPGDYRGRLARGFFSAAHAERLERAMARAAAGESMEALELQTVAGQWIRLRLRPLRARGQVAAVLVVGPDIAAERALAVEAERLDLAREAVALGLWRFDLNTETVVWDARTREIYGLGADEEVTLEAIRARLHPDDVDKAAAHFRRAIEYLDYPPIELRVGDEARPRLVLNVGHVVRDPDGRPTAVVGASVDVSQAHARRQREQAAERLEAMGRLAGGIAHDFNNLLLAISGNLELLPDATGEEREEILGDTRGACARAAELTRGLLAFCRRGELRQEPVDLQKALDDTLALVRRLLPATIRVERRGEGPLPVFADRGQLEQVVLNLCLNARDAMPHGGVIEVDARAACAEELAAHGLPMAPTARLQVSDAGEGIAPEHLEQIFEPFFTTKASGTGLGLASVHGVVRRHGGAVRVRSDASGTRFTVLLPLLAERGADETAAREVDRVRGHETVLLAEDEASVRRALARILRRDGYTVLQAADGEEAVALFHAHRREVAVVIVDAVMPRGSGADVARAIRDAAPDIPVVLSSGYVDSLTGEPNASALFAAFLAKPYPADQLLDTLRQVLDAAEPPRA